MTRIFTWGGEAGDLLDYDVVGSGIIFSTTKHTGAYALKSYITWGTPIPTRFTLPSTVSELHFRDWMCVDNNAGKVGITPLIRATLSDGTYIGVYAPVVYGGAQYSLAISRNGTNIAAGTQVLNVDTWYMIEFHISIHDTTGVAQVKVDGVMDINFTGNTQPSTSSLITSVGKSSGRDGWIVLFDDIAINDTTGAADNSWCGDGRVLAIKPNGAGDQTDLTPLVGSNYENVDEVPADGDTSYNYSAVDGVIDLYNLEPCGLSNVDILGVNVKATLRKEVANGDKARVLAKAGGVVCNGADAAPLTTYTRTSKEWRTNPGTSAAWTVSDVDGLQAGVELRPA